MTVLKALATVVGTALGFGAVGSVIGGSLGKFAPGYYRQVFSVRDPATFNPTELGIGLGLTQGLIWGMIMGVLIVAIIAWKETRLARRSEEGKGT